MLTDEASADVARHLANHGGARQGTRQVLTVLHKAYVANVTDLPRARPGPPGRGIVEGNVGWDRGDGITPRQEHDHAEQGEQPLTPHLFASSLRPWVVCPEGAMPHGE